MNSEHSSSPAPKDLASYYQRSKVQDRILLTGHSHQAWPDCGFEGQQEAWTDAVELLDQKWTHVEQKAQRVRNGYLALMDDAQGEIALGQNTHELLIRLLSALPFQKRQHLVTTQGEFYTIQRQLMRLQEEQIPVSYVPSQPAEDVIEHLIAATTDQTLAVLVSFVFFQTAQILGGLSELMQHCQKHGVALVVDAYHALNVAPFSIRKEGLEEAFVLGGGYKYCQLGEGNAFLRFPKHHDYRPVITGWFSSFGFRDSEQTLQQVAYGSGSFQFAGATYDPTSHYRAARVLDFFEEQQLSPQVLREISQHQIHLLAAQFDQCDLPPEWIDRDRNIPLERIAGFLSLKTPKAQEICKILETHNVFTDSRGNYLRLGPAPYLSDTQLKDGIAALQAVVNQLNS